MDQEEYILNIEDHPLAKDQAYIEKVAFLEIHLLLHLGFLPREIFDGAQVEDVYTLKHTGSGQESERLISLGTGYDRIPTFRFALDPLHGSVLLYAGFEALAAVKYFHERMKIAGWSSEENFDLVVYGSRIAAAQTLGDRKLIVDLVTLKELSPIRERASYEPPADGEGWDWEDELSSNEIGRRKKRFVKNLLAWYGIVNKLSNWRPRSLSLKWFEVDVLPHLKVESSQYELVSGSDPRSCFNLQHQEDPSLCVAASVQMLLDFYRYVYDQYHIADLLKITSGGSATGLFPRGEFEVISVLEGASGGALQARMNAYPNWVEFEEEIKADRPVISLVSSHCRIAVGYSRVDLQLPDSSCGSSLSYSLDGLIIGDPAEGGKIKFFENFYYAPLRINFTARVRLLEPSPIADRLRRKEAHDYLKRQGLHEFQAISGVGKVYGEGGRPIGWLVGVGDRGKLSGVVWGDRFSAKKFFPFERDVRPDFLDPSVITKKAESISEGRRVASPVLRLDSSSLRWTINSVDQNGKVHGKIVEKIKINPPM